MLVFLAVLSLWLGGCYSPKFEKAWKQAQVEGQNQSSQRWSGRWQSDRHGAGGCLRAVSSTPKDGRMAVFFEAGWHGFTTAYPVELQASQKGRVVFITGQHDLKSCVGGGTYTYSGKIQGSVFTTSYASKYDTGTFSLETVSGK